VSTGHQQAVDGLPILTISGILYPIERPVFGEQFDIIVEPLLPITAV